MRVANLEIKPLADSDIEDIERLIATDRADDLSAEQVLAL
jgi:hypothetical protein